MKTYGAVCFVGETEEENEELNLRIYKLIDGFLDCGACGFIFSAESRFGLICARQVLLRKRLQKGNGADFIRLIAFIPYEAHIADESEIFRNDYFELLEKCDAALIFAREKSDFVQSDFIQEIIDMADVVVCAEKCEYARLYATAKNKKIIDI